MFKENNPQASTGLNHLILRNDYLFFANINQKFLAKIAINYNRTPKSNAIVIIVNQNIQKPNNFLFVLFGENATILELNLPYKLGFVRNNVYTEIFRNDVAKKVIL